MSSRFAAEYIQSMQTEAVDELEHFPLGWRVPAAIEEYAHSATPAERSWNRLAAV